MKTIHVENRLGVFNIMLDDVDYEWARPYSWQIHRGPKGKTFYACLPTRRAIGGETRMHRIIMAKTRGLAKSDETDHVDLNGLNNQRDNLRVCNKSQNGANRPKSDVPATSRFKGVGSKRSQWRACIMLNKRSINIGNFPTEREAAIAYDIKAKELFGEFARINLPDATSEEIAQVAVYLAGNKRRRGTASRYLGVHLTYPKRGTWGYRVEDGPSYLHARSGFKTQEDAARARDQYIVINGLDVPKSLP